jgi:hypothetical protein
MSRDVTDTDMNKREVLRRQSGQIIYNVYTFLKKSSDDERAKMDFSKTRELTVQACGTGSVHTALRICSEAKISSVRRKGFPIFTSPGKKHNMLKLVTNLDLKNMFYVELFLDFMTVENFPRQRNSLLN